MTRSIPIRSLMTTLAYTVLILTLAGCGPGFDDGSGADRAPSEIEIRYFEMQAEREERLRTHTGEGPVFTDEELAEFKRMEQRYYAQLEYERIQRQIDKEQSRLREWYEFCEKGHQGNCRDIFKADVEDVDEDERRKTIQTTAYLPNTVIAEYYFGLQGEGCTSNDPVNTWTDVDTVTIQYTGDGHVVPRGDRYFGHYVYRQADCEVNMVLRTPDILVEIPKDVRFKLKVVPNFRDVQAVCSEEEPYRCGSWLELSTSFYSPLYEYHDASWTIGIINHLPDTLDYDYYYDLAGAGCYTDQLIKEWYRAARRTGFIDFNAGLLIKHRGTWVNPAKTEDYVVAECEVSARVRVAGKEPVFIPQFNEVSSKRASKTAGIKTRMETPGTMIVPFTIKPE